MRKLTAGAIVASIALIATPVLAQGHDDHGGGHGGPGGAQHGGPGGGGDHGMPGGGHGGPGGGDRGPGGGDHGGPGMSMRGPGGMGMRGPGGGHRFAQGGRFNPGWAPGYRSVGSWQHYHLRRPPYGYHWVWYDGNFMLVAISTGIIASMIAGAYN